MPTAVTIPPACFFLPAAIAACALSAASASARAAIASAFAWAATRSSSAARCGGGRRSHAGQKHGAAGGDAAAASVRMAEECAPRVGMQQPPPCAWRRAQCVSSSARVAAVPRAAHRRAGRPSRAAGGPPSPPSR
eukprot:5385707-Prymnesium_polylepis.1